MIYLAYYAGEKGCLTSLGISSRSITSVRSRAECQPHDWAFIIGGGIVDCIPLVIAILATTKQFKFTSVVTEKSIYAVGSMLSLTAFIIDGVRYAFRPCSNASHLDARSLEPIQPIIEDNFQALHECQKISREFTLLTNSKCLTHYELQSTSETSKARSIKIQIKDKQRELSKKLQEQKAALLQQLDGYEEWLETQKPEKTTETPKIPKEKPKLKQEDYIWLEKRLKIARDFSTAFLNTHEEYDEIFWNPFIELIVFKELVTNHFEIYQKEPFFELFLYRQLELTKLKGEFQDAMEFLVTCYQNENWRYHHNYLQQCNSFLENCSDLLSTISTYDLEKWNENFSKVQVALWTFFSCFDKNNPSFVKKPDEVDLEGYEKIF